MHHQFSHRDNQIIIDIFDSYHVNSQIVHNLNVKELIDGYNYYRFLYVS